MNAICCCNEIHSNHTCRVVSHSRIILYYIYIYVDMNSFLDVVVVVEVMAALARSLSGVRKLPPMMLLKQRAKVL